MICPKCNKKFWFSRLPGANPNDFKCPHCGIGLFLPSVIGLRYSSNFWKWLFFVTAVFGVVEYFLGSGFLTVVIISAVVLIFLFFLFFG